MTTIEQDLRANTRDGKVPVVVWGRDCDLCESTSLVTIDASMDAYEKLENSVYENAEGPCSLTIISPEEADAFKPSMRDRAAEMMGY